MKGILKNFFLDSYFRLASLCVALAALPLFIALISNEFFIYRQKSTILQDLAEEFGAAAMVWQQGVGSEVSTLLGGLGKIISLKNNSLAEQIERSSFLRHLLDAYGAAEPIDNLVLYSIEGEPLVWAGQDQGRFPDALYNRKRGLLERGILSDEVIITQADTAKELLFTQPLRNELGGVDFFLTAGVQLEHYLSWGLRLDITIALNVFLYTPEGKWFLLEEDPQEHLPNAPDTLLPIKLPPILARMETIRQQLPDSGYGFRLIQHGVPNGEGTLLTIFIHQEDQGTGSPYLSTFILADYDRAFATIRNNARNGFIWLALTMGFMAAVILTSCLWLFKRPIKKLLTISKRLSEGDFKAIHELTKVDGIFAGYAQELRTVASTLEKREEDLREARLNSELAAQSKMEFFANTSHEIRTPMNAILGMTYLALKSELTPLQLGYINKIQDAGKSLLHIINDILDFSKLEEGEISMENSLFSVRDIFSSISGNYRREMRERNIKFILDVTQEVPLVLLGDPLRLEQALSQLTDNAVRHTRNGTVRLSCALVGIARNDCTLRITIADTGEGMRPEFLRLLNQLLEEDDPVRYRNWREQGYGLGVLLACRFIHLMSGTMNMSSELGRGTVCACTVHFDYQEEYQGQSIHFWSNKRVLLFEADPAVRLLHTNLLDSFSLRVEHFGHILAALCSLIEADNQDTGYDFFIMGWRNEDLDSRDLIRHIREKIPLRKIPKIIVTSTFGRSEARLAAEKAGADAFLSTPIQGSLMLDTLILLDKQRENTTLEPNRIEKDMFSSLAGLRVLLVEDNLLHQQTVKDLMVEARIEVRAVESGVEALKTIAQERQPFDIILMDLQLPEMDGFETAWRMRKDNYLKAAHIPIIALVISRNTQETEACFLAGMNDQVTKPVHREVFLATLQRWLPIVPDPSGQAAYFLHELQTLLNRDSALAAKRFNEGRNRLRQYIGEGRGEALRQMLNKQKAEAEGFILYLLNRLAGL